MEGLWARSWDAPNAPKWTNMKHFGLSCYGNHFGPFWSILLHFGAPPVQPHDPFTTCLDYYALLSVHLIQK